MREGKRARLTERVSRWTKDGAWHYTEQHTPTEEDRKCFPVSYPPGDSGPFFRWAVESFETEAEALAAVKRADAKGNG